MHTIHGLILLAILLLPVYAQHRIDAKKRRIARAAPPKRRVKSGVAYEEVAPMEECFIDLDESDL